MRWKLSRRLPVILACIGGGWILLIAFAEYLLPGRGIWLVGAEHDAGVVRAGSLIQHRVWLLNPTVQKLDVRFQPSCGCTVTAASELMLPPLGIRALDLQVNTEGRARGKQQELVAVIVRSGQRAWRELLTVRFTIAAPQEREGKS